MTNSDLATYLNDHLAGSVTAMELLSHLASEFAGTSIESFATALRADVLADRLELEALMSRLNISQSTSRKASAWLAEKLTELKLRIDDPKAQSLRLLEITEFVSLGVAGKRGLWDALSAGAELAPELLRLDYERLKDRADEQRRRLESVRLGAARAVCANVD